jgi:2-C-methyl-D-erythritol 2,4-cyclodiphosphate synthase
VIGHLQYEYRSGLGTDIHRLVPERKLILGGIEIPFNLGLLGHSDGDTLLHAITDAILGAAGQGDIGMLFPDTDPQFKDADSGEMLKHVVWQVSQQKWEIVNVDLIVHAEQPKLGPYRGHIKRHIAELLEIDFANVNIKAKTNEGLDAVGEGRAIAATAAVMLRRKVK